MAQLFYYLEDRGLANGHGYLVNDRGYLANTYEHLVSIHHYCTLKYCSVVFFYRRTVQYSAILDSSHCAIIIT